MHRSASFCVFLVSPALLPVASFAATYIYSGPNYPASEITSSGTPAYTTSMRITGSITTADPLPTNFSGNVPAIQSYRFDDGLHTYDETNSIAWIFQAQTNALGQITGFSFDIVSPKPPHSTGELLNEIFVTSAQTLAASQNPCQVGNAEICGELIDNAPPAVSVVNMQGEGYDPGVFVLSAPAATAPLVSRLGQGVLAGLFALSGIAWLRRLTAAQLAALLLAAGSFQLARASDLVLDGGFESATACSCAYTSTIDGDWVATQGTIGISSHAQSDGVAHSGT